MKRIMMNHSNWDYTKRNKINLDKKKGTVQMGQVLSNKEIYSRILGGNIAEAHIKGEYLSPELDAPDLEKFSKLDLIEREEVWNQYKDTVESVMASEKKRKAFLEAAAQEKLALKAAEELEKKEFELWKKNQKKSE